MWPTVRLVLEDSRCASACKINITTVTCSRCWTDRVCQPFSCTVKRPANRGSLGIYRARQECQVLPAHVTLIFCKGVELKYRVLSLLCVHIIQIPHETCHCLHVCFCGLLFFLLFRYSQENECPPDEKLCISDNRADKLLAAKFSYVGGAV